MMNCIPDNNFLLIFVASSILLSPNHGCDKLYAYADTFLTLFVKICRRFMVTRCVFTMFMG